MDMKDYILCERLKAHSPTFHKVVDFDPAREKILPFDLTNNNKELVKVDITNTQMFSEYVDQKLTNATARYAIGGYNELRSLYERSKVFDASAGDEPRRLHLGIDIWGQEGTLVYAPLDGIVHSFAFNNNFGDYGATLILLHQLEHIAFYTLYGHLSLADINDIAQGEIIVRGQVIGHFGNAEENGSWPPHLHFQVIKDIETYKGDYPGVCKFSEQEKYLANCPDPDLILNMMQNASGKQSVE
jgi:murein DD-endopeptidase MepM/ murein hydrolase activator NlpD